MVNMPLASRMGPHLLFLCPLVKVLTARVGLFIMIVRQIFVPHVGRRTNRYIPFLAAIPAAVVVGAITPIAQMETENQKSDEEIFQENFETESIREQMTLTFWEKLTGKDIIK